MKTLVWDWWTELDGLGCLTRFHQRDRGDDAFELIGRESRATVIQEQRDGDLNRLQDGFSHCCIVTYLSGNHLSRWKLGRFESLRSCLLSVSWGEFRHVFMLRAMRQLLVWIDALLEMKLNVISANICMSNCLFYCVRIRKKSHAVAFQSSFPSAELFKMGPPELTRPFYMCDGCICGPCCSLCLEVSITWRRFGVIYSTEKNYFSECNTLAC